ncbi:UDP-N-acetylmuramoyl-L-alanine--D-glutamate ligase [Candidatus Formimonas warabiya]|uniref:UDP-N-acetylmuramoylalanine--D-glutamate ligase n=1 Tax=Formimonas warabiya TaxID=1761012 RepID=A0A3G1KRI4_FORW1|nr:UDP-N-acetylmuramoyl-L-alanine--D-glutamate ligase [Candidatus Formimonas warabiya]ATW25057.1 UDP-N-acetylmuramoylalanine--D-glutamate ligase [Candidatus Formimonas warabiya]
MWDANVKDKKILVIGAARSGLAVAGFLSQKGALVTLTDAKPAEKLGHALAALQPYKIDYILGREPDIKPGSFDYAVISPGIPLNIPLAKKIRRARIPLTGELEVAFRYSQSPFVAITGTNGKTTTTSLTGQIFSDAGIPVFVGGNIGTPLVTEMERLTPRHVVVAEVSSFQLETIETFCPKVAVILNITPDHLDRHKTMKGYTDAKARIFENQHPDDYTVLNYDDTRVRKLAARSPGQVVFFSQKTALDRGVFVKNGIITVKTANDCINVVNTADIYIKGRHNLENSLAATAAGFCLGVSPQDLAETLKSFPGVVHRLEFVGKMNGVTYVNDSKGTNPDSTMKALEAYDQPIILIAGGKNKGSDFSKMAKLIKKKVYALILVGEAAPTIRDAVEKQGFDAIYQAADYQEVVSTAKRIARPGDVVLLSPACASWDMFTDYEERGNLFKQLVLGMK